MTQDHPITPPPELVQQWLGEFFGCTVNGELSDSERYLATQAARWGADQELEACCDWVEREIGHGREWGAELRAARRPKPPSLKEEALYGLDLILSQIYSPEAVRGLESVADTIRRALEALDD